MSSQTRRRGLFRTSLVALSVFALSGGPAAPASAQTSADELTIVVPAAPGGGWDQTAHVMARVLEAAGIVRRVQITNSPGAGGAIALAEFVNGQRGNAHSLLVGGLVMISAIRATHATVSIQHTTPVARLIGEADVIVVPSDSPFKTMHALVAALNADPAEISWSGGSYGGTDHLLLRAIAENQGVDPAAINYVPFAGGGEELAALLKKQSAAGVGGYAELASGIRAGKLRALAVSAESRLPGVNIPTLKEQGIDVAVMNWRGVFAPPDLQPEDREQLVSIVDRMVRDPLWHREVVEYAWVDRYLSGDAFVQFLTAEQRRVDDYFTRAAAEARPRRLVNPLQGLISSRWMIAIVAFMLALSIPFVYYWRVQTVASRFREHALSEQLETVRHEAEHDRDKAREVLKGLGEEIDKQFEKWGLTAAEREVALLMLKGLRHKEIAVARNTTERTVRQQALAVYKKAGLDGRTDLAAFFLEDLLPPRGSSSPPVKFAS
jgi:putative tricarboxylic transport membrane protein